MDNLENPDCNELEVFTTPVSRGMMRKPEGRRGASSAKDASMGAKTSSAQVPIAFSSTPLQSCAWRKKKKRHYYKILSLSDLIKS